MFTTPNLLTAGGQAALRKLCALPHGAPAVSAHDACWDWVPLARLEKLAKEAFRAAIKAGNYRLDPARVEDMEAPGPVRLLKLAPRKAVRA
jgi:hypothetical protein